MAQYKVLRDTWISHRGLLAKAGEVIDMGPLPKVPKVDSRGMVVLAKDGKPELVEMRIGDNFELVPDDDKAKGKKADGAPA